jgi:hypothetical protein
VNWGNRGVRPGPPMFVPVYPTETIRRLVMTLGTCPQCLTHSLFTIPDLEAGQLVCIRVCIQCSYRSWSEPALLTEAVTHA